MPALKEAWIATEALNGHIPKIRVLNLPCIGYFAPFCGKVWVGLFSVVGPQLLMPGSFLCAWLVIVMQDQPLNNCFPLLVTKGHGTA